MKNLKWILLLISQVLIAQETKLDSIHYFNQIYNPYVEVSGLVSQAVEVVEDGYLVFGNYARSETDQRNYVRKLDLSGSELWFTDYEFAESQEERGVIGYGEQVIKNIAGNLTLAYSYDTTGTGIRSLQKLVEMDIAGNVLKSVLIGDTSKHQISRCIIEIDDGYILLGSETTIGIQLEVTLKKLTYDFEVVWTKYFDMKAGFYVRETFWDNGFLLGGYTTPPNLSESDTHLLKLYSNGEIEWEFHPLEKGLAVSTHPVINTSSLEYEQGAEPEIIVFSGFNPPDSIDLTDNSRWINFRKFNKDGDLIYEKIYTEYDNMTSFHSVRIINDSTIIALARHNYDVSDYDGLLLNISSKDGEIRWTKRIQTNDELHRQDFLFDLQITEDGGYIMAGTRQTPGIQHSWVVKTDSLGNTCGFADCNSISIVEVTTPTTNNNQLTSEFSGIKLYPNPTAGNITVALNSNEPITYQISNSIGQIIMRGVINKEEELITKFFPKGIYYLTLSNGKTAKFIVMK